MVMQEVERLLLFVKTGKVKLPNKKEGCQQDITPAFKQIADAFLAGDMHPNTRNDARWVVCKYFAWLEETGFENLHGVGALQIQKFMITAPENLL